MMIAEVPVDPINIYRLFLLPRIGCMAEDTQRHKGGAQTRGLQTAHERKTGMRKVGRFIVHRIL